MKTIDPKYLEPVREFSELDEFTRAYITTALWSSIADNDDPLDKDHDWRDLAPETLAEMRHDCAQFQELYGDTIRAAIESGVTCGPDFDEWGRAGHDFWLTRCGHGAGFWDGDWPEPQGEHLTDAAGKCNNVDLYVGDDGRIYAS